MVKKVISLNSMQSYKKGLKELRKISKTHGPGTPEYKACLEATVKAILQERNVP